MIDQEWQQVDLSLRNVLPESTEVSPVQPLPLQNSAKNSATLPQPNMPPPAADVQADTGLCIYQ